MKNYLVSRVLAAGFFAMTMWLLSNSAFAAPLVPIEDAVDMIGQYVDPGADPLVLDYTGLNPNSGRVGRIGFSTPYGIVIDEVGRRLFTTDSGNNRILIFNLDENLRPLDALADYVLGQPDFVTNTAVTSATGLSAPAGLAYASTTQLLYVADHVGNRVLVYDVSSITNGEAAIYVLGQPDFITNTGGLSASSMFGPSSVVVDTVNSRLFVGEEDNSRVIVFDVSTITNGESALNVLGQVDFTTNISSTTATGLRNVYSLQYEYERQYLYVANWARISVFDVASITDTEPALGVLSALSITSSASGCCITPAEATSYISGLAFDPVRKYLFANNNRRITIYDTTSITTPGTYVNVLGVPVVTNSGSTLVVGTTTVNTGTSGIGGAVFASTTLYVADSGYNRVMAFDVENIGTGEPAVSVLGQNHDTANGDMSSQYFFSGNRNNGVPRATTFSSVGSNQQAIEPLIDTVNDRLFVSDSSNNRVLVFNLDSSHRLIDRVADYVLGQPDFITTIASSTQTGMNRPRNLAYDPVNNRLFVSNNGTGGILVYDVTTITNGEPAVNVLGKANFTTSAGATSATSHRTPAALAYSTTTGYLFAVHDASRIIYVYNTADGITNGEAAISVIGNSTFFTYSGTLTQSRFGSTPMSLAIDEARQFLYVGEDRRILVFDAATTTSDRNALYVLGQPDYTSSLVNTRSRRSTWFPRSMVYVNNKLMASMNIGIRVFDLEVIENNEPAIAYAGRETFESSNIHVSSIASSTSLHVGFIAYDQDNELLYLGQPEYNRVAIFNAGPDTTAPALSSATTSTDGTTIYLQYSEFLEDVTIGAPTSTDYIITINGATSSPVSVTIASSTILLVSTSTIYQGNTVTVSYIAGDNSVRDYSGNEAINLTNTAVTNLSTITDPNAPVEPDPEPEPTPSRRRSSGGRVVRTPTIESTPSNLQQQSNTPQTLPPSRAGSTVFTRNLTSGTTGEDVRTLQRFLNSQGYTVATQGNGSNGQETTFFGRATEAALKQFQIANNITPTGTMGPLTQARIAELTANAPVQTPAVPTTSPTAPQTTTPSSNNTNTYTRDLTIGSRGSDITSLQNFLIQQGYLESGFATGYFGQLTQSALIRFQQANNISPAVGYFGAKTRGVVEGR